MKEIISYLNWVVNVKIDKNAKKIPHNILRHCGVLLFIVGLNPKICQAAEDVEQQKIDAPKPDFSIFDFVGQGVKQNIDKDIHLEC